MLGLAALAGAGVAIVAFLPLGGEAPSAPSVPATPPTPPVPGAVTTGPFALGINEAVSVPTRGGELQTMSLAEDLAADAALARDVGATLVRGHTGAFPRLSMSSLAERPDRLEGEGDLWVRTVQGAGLEAVLMVSPWPANRTANYTEHYVPSDMAAYEAYVRRVVERYDGDGVDDMPGLQSPVRYWEVDNEPDLKLNLPPKDPVREFTPGTFCLPEEYAQVLIASYRAIHAAYPDARVLGGGMNRPHAETGEAYLRDLFAIPGALDAIDILSLHTYDTHADGRRLASGIRAGRAAAPGKPIWVTETSVSLTQAPRDPVDTEVQGRMVAVLVGEAAVAGAERLFWHTLSDPPESGIPGGPNRVGGSSTNSLFRMVVEGGPREDKPAATVYRNLAAVLRAHDLAGAAADGQGAARMKDGTVLVWEGSRPAPNGGQDLRTGAAIPPGGTANAPAVVWGAG